MIRSFDWMRVAGLAAALACSLGCAGDPVPKDERPPLEGQSVRVLVVDDKELAAAVRDLELAWKQRSGAELSVTETTAAALLGSQEKPAADLLIYPTPFISTPAQRQWLLPLAEKMLTREEFHWADVFTALRDREATWDRRTVAVPLGSRVLACFYRADLFKRFGKKPPETWQQYQELVDFFSDRGGPQVGSKSKANGQGAEGAAALSWVASAEPFAEGAAGITLLARAAAYAKHRDYYTVLFNPRTMEPRITGPPFVRALEELAAANRASRELALRLSPVDTLDELLAGRCALALGWPRSRGETAAKQAIDSAAVACAPLPGSREAFAWDKGAYEPCDLHRVPLLACAGRSASVMASAQFPAAAHQLLVALGAGDWSVPVSSASSATAVFRGSQLAAAERWTSPGNPTATAYAQAVAESLDTPEVVYALRMPGREEYLAALDRAVRSALLGKAKPAAALDTAAAEWRAITGKFGVDAQRKACEQGDARRAL